MADPDLLEQLAHLGSFRARIEAPDFNFGEWVPSTKPAPGVLTMPYFAFSPDGLALLAAMPVQMGFDWGAGWAPMRPRACSTIVTPFPRQRRSNC